MDQPVLVTGYGGFLGAAICHWLLERGYNVRGIARNRYPDLVELGVEAIEGDLRSKEDVAKACKGICGIIHTAAIAGVWGKRSTYESINIDSTANLLDAAKANGIPAFVYSSSPSVTFSGKAQSGIDETVPYPNHWYCDYPRTKAIAETKVLASNDEKGLLTCSLRPHLIWGKGDPHLIPRLIERHKAGRLRCVGNGRNLIDTVHVDAAAEAHGLALEKLLQRDTEAAGRAYFITDGAPVECWEWISSILTAAGLKPTNRSISLSMAYGIGGMLEIAYRVMGKQEEPPMTRFVALQLGVDHYFSIDEAKKRLGYQPPQDRKARFEEMIPWLKDLARSR